MLQTVLIASVAIVTKTKLNPYNQYFDLLVLVMLFLDDKFLEGIFNLYCYLILHKCRFAGHKSGRLHGITSRKWEARKK